MDKEILNIAKICGQRMKQARELCNLTQKEAAHRLGYKNGSKLSKIEGASMNHSMSLAVLLKASVVYDVSIDFLCGKSDDWERDPILCQQREIAEYLQQSFEKAHVINTRAILELSNRVLKIQSFVGLSLKSANNSAKALSKFHELNEDYDELRGGASLNHYVKEAVDNAKNAMTLLDRFHNDCKQNSKQQDSVFIPSYNE